MEQFELDRKQRMRELSQFLSQKTYAKAQFEEYRDEVTYDLVKHYQNEGGIDLNKFKSEQKTKSIKTILKQKSQTSLNMSLPHIDNKNDSPKKGSQSTSKHSYFGKSSIK